MNRGDVLSGIGAARASTYTETYESNAVHVGTGSQASPTQMLNANHGNRAQSQPPPKQPGSGIIQQPADSSNGQMKTGLMIAGAVILLWWLTQ